MNDSVESSAQEGRRWLLLIHQLPPKPDYVRVKVRRRLHRLGAVALKSSVYVLPDSEEHLEDFQWLANEIIAAGGDATICSAAMLSGVTDAELDASFGIVDAGALETTELGPAPSVSPGSIWVTRQGVFIDRIASAWLIRRFIDREARFRFTADMHYVPRPGEYRFDMFGGEFTHVGDRCTFEVLLARFGLRDAALRDIAEIVHDIDCKDDKFGRAEAAGVAAVMRGIASATDSDAERLERGALVLEGLYQRRG